MKTINFSPFATNILDMLNKPLVDSSGNNYLIEKPLLYFTVKINGKVEIEDLDNYVISAFLNNREVGIAEIKY